MWKYVELGIKLTSMLDLGRMTIKKSLMLELHRNAGKSMQKSQAAEEPNHWQQSWRVPISLASKDEESSHWQKSWRLLNLSGKQSWRVQSLVAKLKTMLKTPSHWQKTPSHQQAKLKSSVTGSKAENSQSLAAKLKSPITGWKLQHQGNESCNVFLSYADQTESAERNSDTRTCSPRNIEHQQRGWEVKSQKKSDIQTL